MIMPIIERAMRRDLNREFKERIQPATLVLILLALCDVQRCDQVLYLLEAQDVTWLANKGSAVPFEIALLPVPQQRSCVEGAHDVQ